VPDLVDKAKIFIADLKQVAPDRPFFMYFCPGACHAPHQAPKEWIARYKGKFDAGWDDYREKTLAKQIEMGICPKGTKLAPRDPEVPEWKTLSQQEKDLYARQMEVFAAYLAYADHNIGELISFLDKMGQLDNTLIITVSDNGASAEGGPIALLERGQEQAGDPRLRQEGDRQGQPRLCAARRTHRHVR
jgi:arylsulfatase